MSGDFASVWGNWAHANYYHWLIECLPRLARLGAITGLPPISLLMPKSMPAVWEDSLACCLPDGMRVQRASGWSVGAFRIRFLQQSPGGLAGASDREYMRGKVFARSASMPAGNRPSASYFTLRA
jgi:hypothetical protein